MAVVSDHYFPSANGTSQIHYRIWMPENCEVRAVIQLTHGIAEHIDRYGDFADFLTRHGFAVAGMDLPGHGDSICEGELKGFFADKDGWRCAVQDIRSLMSKMHNDYPDKPCFLFGHSMGSFLVRTFLILYPDAGLKGAILSGTGYENIFAIKFGMLACAFEAGKKGVRNHSTFLCKLAFDGHNKPFEPARTKFDWLSRDNEIVDKYIADENCGFDSTIGLIQDMVGGIAFNQKKKNLAKMNKSLPVLFVSGGRDAVGAMGKGPRKAYGSFVKAGASDAAIKIYPEARHEILNEINRQEVYNDILVWIESKMG